MSLLMKALEKAAKEREDPQPDAKAPAARTELALELMSDGATAQSGPAGSATPSAAPRTSARAESPPSAEQRRAATVIKASGAAAAATDAGSRSKMLIVFGVLAALAAIGFGAYVYLQITNPALFQSRPPAPGPLAKAPPPPPAGSAPAPVPTSSVVQPGAPEPVAAASAAEAPARKPAAPAAQPQPPAAAPTPPGPANRIVVSRGSAEPKLNPLLANAYSALQSGRLDVARNQYDQVLKTDPRDIDALLGLAAISVQENRPEEATKQYLRILDLDPRHALAQAGLIALLGRADPLSAETRLKQLIARDPSPYLHFTLGNLYADQGLWPQAQHAYFQAHHLDPANPEYAFNLAIGLEHVGQSKLALGFYRRAVQLAAARGQANFDVPQVQDRILRLAAQVE